VQLEHQHLNEPELVLNLLTHGPIERGLNVTNGGVDLYSPISLPQSTMVFCSTLLLPMILSSSPSKSCYAGSASVLSFAASRSALA
jgi:hypothetical protein